VDEPFGVCGVGGVEHARALVSDCLGQSVVDVSRGMQAQPGVAVFVVVPAEEVPAVPTGALDRVESPGEVGPVFQRLELSLAVIPNSG
jgi:hypothetical protein